MNARQHERADVQVPVSVFRDARDVIPVRRLPTYPRLVAQLAPSDPVVRDDVTARLRRDRAALAGVAEDVLAPSATARLLNTRWFRTLERVAWEGREGGESPSAVRDLVDAKARELSDGLARAAKSVLPCWSPCVYRRGAARGADGVEFVTALVLDHDDGLVIDEAVQPWLDWPLVVHTSWSHTPEHPRFRIVLVLAEPVPAAEWPRAWRWASSRSGGRIDPACKDPSRLYLLPALPARGAPFDTRIHDPGGPLLRIDTSDVVAEPVAPSRSSTSTSPSDVRLARARYRLRTDRVARELAATWLGARTTNRRAEGVKCPGCGRDSAWFWLDPGAQSTAVCQHKNSCGWWGHLDALLSARGGADV